MPENQFSVAVPNILQALTVGEQAYKDRQQSVARNQLQQILSQDGPIDLQRAAIQQLSRGDIEGAKTLGTLYGHQVGANSVFGTPIYGTVNGQPAIGTFDKGGNFRPINTNGFQVTPGIKTIDTPQGVNVIDSKSGQPIGGSGAPVQAQPQSANAPLVPRAVQTQSFYPKDYVNTEASKVLGKETGEKQAAIGQAKSALDTNLSALDQFQQQANEVLQHPGLGRITGMTGMLPNVPGFSGADAQAKLDTLKAKSGFAALQAMRNASKTGGALGAVSDYENKNLQNSMVELQNAQSEKQLKSALQKLIGQIDGMKDRLRQAYETDYSGLQRPASNTLPAAAAPAAPQIPKVGEVRDGYRFRGGNPADPSSWVQTR